MNRNNKKKQVTHTRRITKLQRLGISLAFGLLGASALVLLVPRLRDFYENLIPGGRGAVETKKESLTQEQNPQKKPPTNSSAPVAIPPEFALLTVAADHLRAGRWKAAEAILATLHDRGLAAETQETLAVLRYGSGEKEAALDTLKNALRKEASGATRERNLKLLVDMLLRMERYQEANTYLNDLDAMLGNAFKDEFNQKKQLIKQSEEWEGNSNILQEGNVLLRYPKDSPLYASLAGDLIATLNTGLVTLNQWLPSLPAGTLLKAHLHQGTADESLSSSLHTSVAPQSAAAWFDGHMHFFVNPLDVKDSSSPSASANPARKQASSDNTALLRLRKQARHELVHGTLDALCGAAVPPWLGEGLAQLHEGISPSQSLMALTQGRSQRGPTAIPLPPGVDLRANPLQLSNDSAPAFYAASHLLVLDLVNRHGADTLVHLVEDACGASLGFSTALQTAWGESDPHILWDAVRF